MNRVLRAFGSAGVVAAAVAAGWFGRGAMPAPPPMTFTARPASPVPCLPPSRELPLDTETGPPPPRPPRHAPRPPSPSPSPASGVARHVQMADDDDVPGWAKAGIARYTVIESSTLAENVGLLPLGTAAAHPEWTFDVVALIEAEREGHPVCPPGACATPKDVPEAAFLAVSHAR